MRRNLLVTATKFPGYDTQTQCIPFTHIVIGDRAAESGARIAIITVTSRVLEEALTIFELVRQTQVPVDTLFSPNRLAMEAPPVSTVHSPATTLSGQAGPTGPSGEEEVSQDEHESDQVVRASCC